LRSAQRRKIPLGFTQLTHQIQISNMAAMEKTEKVFVLAQSLKQALTSVCAV
jgi:hypothetical protein